MLYKGEYQEIKEKLNLTITKTAKDIFRGLSEKYRMPISKIIEIIARSPEVLSKIESILKVESEKIEKLRAKSKRK